MKTQPLIQSLLTLGLLAAWTASSLMAAERSQAALKAEANVGEVEARNTALARVPGGTIRSSEVEKENGRLIWSFDIGMPRSRNITEVQVDAKTGRIVSTQIETPADQAREANDEPKIKR